MNDKLMLEISRITKEYLFNVNSFMSCNPFDIERRPPQQKNKFGFELIDTENDNKISSIHESEFEGITREFLVNPLIDMVLTQNGIECKWGNFNQIHMFQFVSNLEYERDSYYEFRAVIDGKEVAYRYTEASFSEGESYAMVAFINNFLKTGREFCVIDWTKSYSGRINQSKSSYCGKRISIEEFLCTFLTETESKVVISVAKDAVRKARDLLAVNSIPQLLPSNLLFFKDKVIKELCPQFFASCCYEFAKKENKKEISEQDLEKINDIVFRKNYIYSLVGNADFSQSFITSEYLFSIFKAGLGIDYTAVVVGYIKSVEQLLYHLFKSSFENNQCMLVQQERGHSKSQEYDKKEAYEMGPLIWFVRNYKKIRNVSREGKEYICSCLLDFKEIYRNNLFHKDNISHNQYDEVKRIRNNAIICIYYILGGFIFLEDEIQNKLRLGMINYSFEKQYFSIREGFTKVFLAKLHDGYEGIVYYLDEDENIEFDSFGILSDAKLKFVKLKDLSRENLYKETVEKRIRNRAYIEENTIIITHENQMEIIEHLHYVKNENKKDNI